MFYTIHNKSSKAGWQDIIATLPKADMFLTLFEDAKLGIWWNLNIYNRYIRFRYNISEIWYCVLDLNNITCDVIEYFTINVYCIFIPLFLNNQKKLKLLADT